MINALCDLQGKAVLEKPENLFYFEVLWNVVTFKDKAFLNKQCEVSSRFQTVLVFFYQFHILPENVSSTFIETEKLKSIL